MKCINCNREINDGARLCNYCGTAQPLNNEVYDIAGTATRQEPPAQPADNQAQQQPPASDDTTLLPMVRQGQQLTHTQSTLVSHDSDTRRKRNGTSAINIALIALAIILGLTLVGGTIWYFFFYNNVKRLDADMQLVEFNRKGGKKKVTIDTDAKTFEITDSPQWVDVDIDDDLIVIQCEKLSGDKDRKGNIEVTAGNKTIEITVKQSAAASYIDVTQSILRADASGGVTDIDIDTDGNVETFDFDIDVDWIRVTGKTPSSITLEIDQNLSSYTRSGEVTIASGKNKETITVEQEGLCSYCNGTRRTTCSECYGSGNTYDFQWDEYIECGLCGGTGYMSCPYCSR